MNHVTFHLNPHAIHDERIVKIMKMIGFQEVEPDDPFEHGYDVRWFRRWNRIQPDLHLVADGEDDIIIGLSHFCVRIPWSAYRAVAGSEFCTRNSGSGRLWMELDSLRIEVRPPLPPEEKDD